MEPLGRRIAAIRKEHELSQRALAEATEIDQPRIARIERGDLPASVAVIEKLAAALHRTPTELVKGTDREGHYFAHGVSPQELAAIEDTRKLEREFNALTLLAAYNRIVALFQAHYGGPYVVAEIRGGEEQYLTLCDACERISQELGDAPDLVFPEHFEIIDEDDALEWEFTERELRESQLRPRRYVHELDPRPGVRAFAEKKEKETFERLDGQIAQLHENQKRANKEWVDKLNRLKDSGHFGDPRP